MNIKLENGTDLDKPGIYKIYNTKNGKFYIGSTTMRVLKRIQHHYHCLKTNTHKNIYLQNAWNKYGENSFEFVIFENCDKQDCLPKEQIYINQYKELLYNINPLASGTPNMSKETVEKRSETRRKTVNKSLEYFRQIREDKITIEKVPEKYQKLVKSYINRCKTPIKGYEKSHIPWDKGLTKKDIDYSFLKGVPKTITKLALQGRTNMIQTMRNRKPSIYVYNEDMLFLGKWKNSNELSSCVLDSNFIKNMKLRKGRNGYTPEYLSIFNIEKSCRTGKQYKGLYFSNKPLHQEIDVEKLDKNGEL